MPWERLGADIGTSVARDALATGPVTSRLGGRHASAAARRWALRHHGWLALLLYLLGAMLMQRHAVAHLGSQVAANLPIDVTQFFWTMWWWPHAILHGYNPFVTHAIWAPDGLNMAAVTGLPVPSTLMAPVTALFGPIVSYNVVSLIAPVLSGWFTYRLCWRLTNSPAAAIAAGWLFAFSSYELSQLGGGHPNLTLAFAPPALLLLTARRLDGTLTARRYVELTAVVLIAALGCNPEIVFMTTVFGAVALVCGVACSSGEKRRRLLALIPPLAIAYALTAVVCSPFLYYLVSGPALSKGVDRLYFADLLSYAFPTPITLIGHQRFLAISSGYFSGYVETGTYVGVAGIIVFAAYAVESWARTVLAKVVVITTLVAAVLSLGITLEIDGHPTIWLPYHALVNLPGFTEALPVRLGLFVELGVAIATALWLAEPSSWRIGRWALALFAIVLIWPNTNGVMPGTPPSSVYDTAYNVPGAQFSDPPFLTDGAYRRYLRRNEVILPIPYGQKGASLLWQAVAHGYFRMASGYFGYVPPDFFNDPVFQELYGAAPYTDPVAGMRSFLRRHRVGAVVIEDGQGGPWTGLMQQLGLTAEAVDGVVVYPVTSAALPR
ncbi:MAG: hypothetical protein ACLP0J_01600 [Solirubrobacteraceae bacterium]